MNINEAFPGAYLSAPDLKGRAITIAMHSVVMEEVNSKGGTERKPVLYFMDQSEHKKERGLILNKTNAAIIAEMYGPETDEWHGNIITLYPARVEFGGKIVDAIRIKLDAAMHPSAKAEAVSRPIQPPVLHNSHRAPIQPPAAPIAGTIGDIIQDEVPF